VIELFWARPAQLLAETLFHFLWQGLALAFILAILMRTVRSPQQRYAASLCVLIAMLAAPAVTYRALWARDVARSPVVSANVVSRDIANGAVAGNPVPPTNQEQTNTVEWLAAIQPLCVALWMIGVVLFGTRLLVGYVGTLWLRRDRLPLPAELAQRVAWLGRKLGVITRGRVFLSRHVDEAIAVGCLKPLVLVPLAWASELPPSVLEAVIAHELAHIRRWDLWATVLQRITESLLFYHPAVWWVSRRMSIERELCCDDLAVAATQRRTEYAMALELLARRMSPPPLALATSFFGGGNMNLLERVRNVLTGGSPRDAAAWWPAGLAALVAPFIAVLALLGWSPVPSTATADDDDRKVEQRGDDDDDRQERNGKRERDDDDDDDDEGDDDDDDDEGDDDDDARKNRSAKRAREDVKDVELFVKLKRAAQEEDRDPPRKGEKEEARKESKGEKFSLEDFRPQTDREERLFAIIAKLQAELRGRGEKKSDGDYKIIKKEGEEKKVIKKSDADYKADKVVKKPDADYATKKEKVSDGAKVFKKPVADADAKAAYIKKLETELAEVKKSLGDKGDVSKEELYRKQREAADRKEGAIKKEQLEGELKKKEAIRKDEESKEAALRKKELSEKDRLEAELKKKEAIRKDEERKEKETRKDEDRKES